MTEATIYRSGSDIRESLRRIDPQAISVWLLAFGLVVYLSLKGGGYDAVIRNQTGIAVWWIVLAGVGVGVLPRRRPGRLALTALGLLAAYAVWTGLSLAWSESPERSSDDLGRIATYLGIFALALSVRDSKGARRLVAALGSAVAVVALVGLASRLHPAWFPDASETARFLPGARSRLAYPLNFWNGLAALVAIGLPLVLHLATASRSIAARAVAAGALPALALTIFFTFSRGGTIAAIAGLALFVALTSDRAPKLLTALIAATGSAILIVAATQRDALENGLLNEAARHQGNELLAMTIVVCAGVALLQAGLSLALRHERAPRLPALGPREVRIILGGVLVAAVIAAVAVDLPGRASNAWGEFKSPDSPGGGAGRLESFQGNGRYQYWEAALDESRSETLAGTGSGTFEFWWSRNGSIGGFVRDAHSLYLETLGELGVIGFLLVVGFLGVVLAGGAIRALDAVPQRRAQMAAALGGCLAFCVAAAFDWVWELAAIPIAFLLLASVLLTAGDRRGDGPGLATPWRVGAAIVAIAAIVAVAVPLSSTMLLRESQAEARTGDLTAALEAAHTGRDARPFAASPRLQEALVLELGGHLGGAAAAAREATEREETNWRNWLVLSRIEAERGRAAAAVGAYRRARALNPHSALFVQ